MKTVVLCSKDKGIAIEILQQAKCRIKNYQDDWVCYAIVNSSSGGHNIADRLVNLIDDRLDGHALVSCWLAAQPGVKRADTNCDETMRLYRMRWIDSMIKEVEEVNV